MRRSLGANQPGLLLAWQNLIARRLLLQEPLLSNNRRPGAPWRSQRRICACAARWPWLERAMDAFRVCVLGGWRWAGGRDAQIIVRSLVRSVTVEMRIVTAICQCHSARP